MDDLLAIGSEYVTAVGSIGVITGIYVLSFLFCCGYDDSKIIKGEVNLAGYYYYILIKIIANKFRNLDISVSPIE